MKNLAVALSATMLVIGIVAVHLWRELNAGREQLAALQVQVSELENARSAAAAAAAQAAPAIVADLAAPPAPDTAPAAPTEPAATSSRGSAQPTTGDLATGMAAAMTTPAGQEIARRQVRAELARQYPDIASELGLSPVEADAILDLLARQAADMTANALGMLAGGSGSAAALEEASRGMMERQEAAERELQAMLGGRYPQWQEYQGTVAARQQVNQLRALLGSGENALSEEKAKPLIAALGAETARGTREYRERSASGESGSQSMLEDQLDFTTRQNTRFIEVADPYLTAAQLDRYRGMLQQQEAMMRMLTRAVSGQSSAQGGAPR